MKSNGTIPPQAAEVEENILGSVLLEREAADIVFSTLKADDFYKPANRQVFEVSEKLYNMAKPIDIITLESELKKINQLDMVGGIDYLSNLTRSVGSAANVEHYCQIVKEMSMRRQVIRSCYMILRESYDTSLDTGDVIDKAQSEMFAITEHQQGNTLSLAQIIQQVSKKIDEIQTSGKPIGLRSGLDIDKYLRGFQKGKFYVIGARPSMGKTALVMTIMRMLAKEGHGSGLLSLETSHESLAVRLIAQVTRISAERITSGKMTETEMKSIYNAYVELSEYGIYIDDEAALTVQKVRSKCRLLVRKGVKVIFIDFLQLMQAQGRSRHEEIGNFTKALKQISKELNIPIVALSQLSRKVEVRKDKRPQMSDLRESGSIEEDADAILFLYRPEYYGVPKTAEGESTAGLCEVIIAKNKDDQTGLQRQIFLAESMRFENFNSNK